jgi:MFS transporter, PHS family, inorganic phosphate transporter
MMAAVFSMQGIGQLAASLVSLVVTSAFRDSFEGIANVSACDYRCQTAADRAWRIVVGFGALPACFALYYRITIPETPRYTFDVAHDVEKADADIRAYMASKAEGEVDAVQQARVKKLAAPSLNIPSASWPDVLSYFGRWKNLKVLLGTTLSWFFLDLAYYGLGLNNTVVLQAIGYTPTAGSNLYQTLYANSVGTIILACAGSLPGYWTAVFTIDTVGRKPLQLFGFLVLTLLFAVMGFDYAHLGSGAMLALYVLAQFAFNWGPNTTTFIVPGECYPTRYRSTGHGLSAAAGKVGAIVAQVICIPLLTKDAPPNCSGSACSPWLNRLMQLFALFMLCGTIVSLLIPETKGVTLEELAGEPPTSYNAGRNGSVTGLGGGAHAKWNPFRGGQPAGFIYPRVRAGGAMRRGPFSRRYRTGSRTPRSERVGGIMNSPETRAQQAQHNGGDWPLRSTMRSRDGPESRGGMQEDGTRTPHKKGLFFQRHGKRGTSKESDDSQSAFTSQADHEGGEVMATPANVLPGWGAGWGRIDRGGQVAPLENIRLQDVGSLLR